MKAVPRECGALGRVRPAPRPGRGLRGDRGAFVPVRGLPRAGAAVQSLRPRQPLLRPRVLAPGARCGPARSRRPLSALVPRPTCARRAHPALARAPRRARTECDAPGFPRQRCRCFTARMDPRQHRIGLEQRCRRRQQPGGDRHHRALTSAGLHRALALPALRRPVECLRSARLPAPSLARCAASRTAR